MYYLLGNAWVQFYINIFFQNIQQRLANVYTNVFRIQLHLKESHLLNYKLNKKTFNVFWKIRNINEKIKYIKQNQTSLSTFKNLSKITSIVTKILQQTRMYHKIIQYTKKNIFQNFLISYIIMKLTVNIIADNVCTHYKRKNNKTVKVPMGTGIIVFLFSSMSTHLFY